MMRATDESLSQDSVAALPLSQRDTSLRRLLWIPVPLLLIAMIVLWAAGLRTPYESPRLLLALNLVFSTTASLFVAYLIGRSFLARGAPGLLMLGCGVVIWGAAGLVGVTAGLVGSSSSPIDINVVVTIHNTCVWLSALCHLTGAVLSLRPNRLMHPVGPWLGGSYAGALGAVGLVTWGTISHWMPTFFIQGQGGTVPREVTLASAIAMFALAAALLAGPNRRQLSAFRYWYTLALALIAVGLFGIMIESVHASPLSWAGRAAQFLSGMYMFMAAMAAWRETDMRLLPARRASGKARYGYAVAVAIVLGAAAVRLAFLQSLEMHATFVTFYPAVMLAALYGGLRAGLLAAVLSALLADYFWMEPVGQLAVRDPSDWLSMAIFLASCTMVSWITEAMHRAQARAAAAEAEARFAAERVRATEALRESEGKYRNLFENMTEEVHFWKLVRDEEGRIKTWCLVDANPPTLRTWGKTLEDIKGKTTDEIFGPGATEHYIEVVRKIMAEGIPYVFEDYFPHLDKHFRFTSVPLGDYFITTGADITAIKKAHEGLRQSEARLLLALDAANAGTWEWDLRTNENVWSEQIWKLYGLEPHSCLPSYEAWQRMMHPEDRARAGEAVQQAARDGSEINIEFRVLDRDGTIRWLVALGRPQHEAGQLIGYIGIVLDITGRKVAEEAMRENEATLRGILDAAKESIWLFSPDGVTLMGNQTALQRWGRPPETVLGKHWNQSLPPEVAQSRLVHLKQAVESARPVMFEDERAGIRFEHNMYPVVDAEGRVTCVACFSRDITERKRSEEALRETQRHNEFLADLIRTSSQPVGIGYPDGRLGLVNRAFEELTGYTADELHSLDWARVLTPPEWFEMERAKLDELHRTRQPVRYEKEYIRKDGSRVPIELLVHLVCDGDGKPLYYYSFFTDITERKKREEELHRLNRTLKALSSSDQAMLRASDESDYVKEVCRIIVEQCGHAMVWVGYAEQDENKTVRPVAHAGFDEGCIQSLQITWADTQHGRGPTGMAIRTGKVNMCRNMLTDPAFEPWRQQALRRGYASSIVLPLMAGARAFGALTIYSRDPDPFSEDEVQLLSDLASDLAHGITAIRLREANAKAEKDLHEAAEQRRLTLEAADLGAWDYRFDTGEVFWDARCRDLFGVPTGNQIQYDTAISKIHPDDRPGVDQAVQQAIAGQDGGAYHREYRVIWPDASVHWVASHGRVYFEGEGAGRRAVRFVGANLDITDRKRAEEAQTRLAAIVESSDDAILSKELDGTILTWNAAAQRLFGYTAEEVIGKSVALLLPPERISEEDQILVQLKAGQRVEHIETVRVTKDGRRLDVSVTVSPLRAADGRIIGASKIVRDITHRKRMEEDLRRTAEELARSNQDLEQFAYVASHDLQEPLRMVAGYLQLIERRYKDKLDQDAREFIDFAIDGATRMSRLITDLLDYSRIHTRGRPLEPVATEKVLEQALRNLQVAIAESGAVVTHDPLPTICGDGTQLVQLLQNLVGNAIKFRDGEQQCRIHIGAQKSDTGWVFCVRDNGIGIDPQYAERIFLIFQRLHSRKEYPGTGIGLAICKRIVERHGGRIWVESSLGQGSTFFFTLGA